MLDTHAQCAATDREPDDLAVGNDRGADHTVIAQAVRHVHRKQAGVRVRGQRRQFARGEFSARRVELCGALK